MQSPTIPPVELEGYTVETGDVDGDGDTDLYLKRVHGSSWALPLYEFLLRNDGSGHFTVETAFSAMVWNKIQNNMTLSQVVPHLTDFNADGYKDLLLTGLSKAGIAANDLVVFASNAPGAPQLKAVSLGPSVRHFYADLFNYLKDPNYFQSANYAVLCSVTWYIGSYPVWGIDGEIEYVPTWYPVPYCVRTSSNPYSPEAEQVATTVRNVLDTRTLEPGSAGAIDIAQAFEQILGVPFMHHGQTNPTETDGAIAYKNMLVDKWGETSSQADSIYNGVIYADNAELQFDMALGDAILYFFGENSPAAPHSYSFDDPICTIGQPHCSLANVWKTAKEVPVTGHSPNTCGPDVSTTACTIPIQTGGLVHVQVPPDTGSSVPDPNGPVPTSGFGALEHESGWIGDVTVTVDNQAHTLKNSTIAGRHMFAPGTVTRHVYKSDGKIYIQTTGVGDGHYPHLNKAVGPSVFANLDKLIAQRVKAGVF